MSDSLLRIAYHLTDFFLAADAVTCAVPRKENIISIKMKLLLQAGIKVAHYPLLHRENNN
jgi:hypothetical protein